MGWRCASGSTSLNPADQRQVVAHVPDMSPAEATAAIDAAAAALPGWRSTPSVERGKLLFRVAALIRDRAEELRHLISLEMGKTIGEATIEVERSAEMLEFYAGIGRLSYGSLIPDRRPGTQAWTVHEPIGVVLAITPWNRSADGSLPQDRACADLWQHGRSQAFARHARNRAHPRPAFR